VFEPLPFQPQGIPTLTMYEREEPHEVLVERFPNSRPTLTALVYAQPLDRSIADGPLAGAPGLAAMYNNLAIDRSISDTLASGPTMPALIFVLPVAEKIVEQEVISAPGLSGLVYYAPVSRSTSEPIPINSKPGLSGMVYTPATPGVAPTLTYNSGEDDYYATIMKSLQAAEPDYFESFSSTTGNGNPDTDASWYLQSSGPSTDGGTYWSSPPLGYDSGTWQIAHYIVGGVGSNWSNKLFHA
jgi:hypothetical protein